MGRIGNELSLARDRALQSLEHGVHGLGQAVDLVAGVRFRHPPMQGRCTDGVGFGSDELDRA